MKNIPILFLLVFFNLISINGLYCQDSLFKVISPSDYEIILLGEQTHGDGAVFDKKIEMIKELHENHGFNLLVFESGMYDNFKANELYNNKKENISIYNQSVGWLYSSTEVFQELLNYMKTHPELKILGFDSQESTLFEEYFLKDFKSFCSKNNIVISDEDYTEIEKTMVVRDFEKYAFNKKDSTNLYNSIHSIIEKIDLIPKKDIETKVLVQTFKSVFSDLDFGLKSLQKEKIAMQNPRDKQMAENLIFIKETYPSEKIMGWGASYHFANRISEFEYTTKTENYIKEHYSSLENINGENYTSLNEEITQIKELGIAIPMGQILKEKYGDKLFSIAFTSHTGNYFDFSVNESIAIQTPPTNSLESYLKNKNTSDSLLRLNKRQDKTYSSPLGYIPIYAHWNNIFDGIYYIEKMYPPKYNTYENEATELIASNQQNTNKGTIVDDETSIPIVHADVYYADQNSSTVTNEEGEYNIRNSKNNSGYLVFSSIGYESDSIPIKSLQKNNKIRLKRSKNDVILNEVTVTADYIELSAEDILKKAQKSIETNYIQAPYNQTFHYKVITYSTKDSISKGEEAIIETYNKKGINGSIKPENNIYAKIKHLRTNTDIYEKRKFQNGVGDLWVILNRDIILSKSNVLYRTGSYDLKKDKILNYENQKVYKINFTNNSPGSYSTGYGYPAPIASSGSIYISSENYAVLKYEHTIERAEYETKRTKKLIKQNHNIVQTYKNINGKYFFNLLDVSTKTEVSSTDHQHLHTVYYTNNLVSNNIEINAVKSIKRPLAELKSDYKKQLNDTFWDDKPLDFQVHVTANKI